MKILVCGGRNYGKLEGLKRDTLEWEVALLEKQHIFTVLDILAIHNSKFFDPEDNWLPSDIEIIAGGASGVDSRAIDWAIVNWAPYKEFPANWEKYGKSAGFIRNAEMLDYGPDLVVAFPGGKGTAHMVKIAQEKGVPVHVVSSL